MTSPQHISAADVRSGKVSLKPKKAKYGNKPVVIDGRRYASELEATHCLKLIEREEKGEIGGLELQRRFKILGNNGEVICVYVADAAFWDHKEDRFRVLDFKGFETEVFKLKRKMMRALKGIDVEVVR